MAGSVLEEIGAVKGVVCKMMPEIELGAALDKQNNRKIYFSSLTKFSNTTYSDLSEGNSVEMFVVRNSRGLFAQKLSLVEVHTNKHV